MHSERMQDRQRLHTAPARLIERLHQQGIPRGVILDAIRYVPRDAFVSPDLSEVAWENRPLDIGEGQTISQPYTVGFMLQLAAVAASDRVLEVGAGSGYVLALLSYIVGDPKLVTGVERNEILCEQTRGRLRELGLDRVRLMCGDGREGCRQHAPYDAIIVSAQTESIPPQLTDQLAPGGRLVIPVDVGSYAAMTRVVRGPDGLVQTRHGAFQFVPLV